MLISIRFEIANALQHDGTSLPQASSLQPHVTYKCRQFSVHDERIKQQRDALAGSNVLLHLGRAHLKLCEAGAAAETTSTLPLAGSAHVLQFTQPASYQAAAPTWVLLEELQNVLKDGAHAPLVLALHIQHNICGRRQQQIQVGVRIQAAQAILVQQGALVANYWTAELLPTTHRGRAARGGAGSNPPCHPPLSLVAASPRSFPFPAANEMHRHTLQPRGRYAVWKQVFCWVQIGNGLQLTSVHPLTLRCDCTCTAPRTCIHPLLEGRCDLVTLCSCIRGLDGHPYLHRLYRVPAHTQEHPQDHTHARSTIASN